MYSTQRAQERGRGRHAMAPWQIPWAGWKDIFWRTYQQIGEDRLLAVAAGVVFYGSARAVPLVTALVSLYGLFTNAATISEHISLAAGLLPGGGDDILEEQVKRITSKGDTKLGLTFLFGLGLAIWSANAGMKAIIDALNVIYDEKEKRGFIKLNLLSLAFTFGGIVAILLAIGAVVVLPLLLSFVGLGGMSETLLRVLRWPALLVVVVLGLAVLYRFGPSRDRSTLAVAQRGERVRVDCVARKLGSAFLVPGEFRRLRRDLRLARRRHRIDDVDVGLRHRDPVRCRAQLGDRAPDRARQHRGPRARSGTARRCDGRYGRPGDP